MINKKVQNISLIEGVKATEENKGTNGNIDYNTQKKRSINRKESRNEDSSNQNQFRLSGSCKNWRGNKTLNGQNKRSKIDESSK